MCALLYTVKEGGNFLREISPKPLTDGDFSCIIHTQASIMYALNEALNPHNANYVDFFIFYEPKSAKTRPSFSI